MIKYKHVVVIPNTDEQSITYRNIHTFYLEESCLFLWFGELGDFYNIPSDLISKIIVVTE